jgi:hypothetical protein
MSSGTTRAEAFGHALRSVEFDAVALAVIEAQTVTLATPLARDRQHGR